MGNIKAYAEELRSLLEFRQVAEMYGMEFNRSGYANCPLHSEKTPSFRAQNRQWGHCFSCGANLDIISLTSNLFGLNFIDAVRKLNEDFSVGLPIDRTPTADERKEIQRRYDERMSVLKAERERREKLQAEYDRWWELSIDYEIARRKFAPKSPDEPLDPRFAAAIKNHEYVQYRMDCLQEKLNTL